MKETGNFKFTLFSNCHVFVKHAEFTVARRYTKAGETPEQYIARMVNIMLHRYPKGAMVFVSEGYIARVENNGNDYCFPQLLTAGDDGRFA